MLLWIHSLAIFLWWNVVLNPCLLSSLYLCPLSCDLLFIGWLSTQSTFLVYCPLLLTILLFKCTYLQRWAFACISCLFSSFQVFEFVIVKLQCWVVSTNMNEPPNGYQGNFLNSYYDFHKNQITNLDIFDNAQFFEKINHKTID